MASKLQHYPESMSRRIYVGNVPWDCTEEKLYAAFAAEEGIQSVQIIRDNATGASKGFGFAVFTSPAQAEQARQRLNGQLFMDRPLRLGQALKPGTYVGHYNSRYNTNRTTPAVSPLAHSHPFSSAQPSPSSDPGSSPSISSSSQAAGAQSSHQAPQPRHGTTPDAHYVSRDVIQQQQLNAAAQLQQQALQQARQQPQPANPYAGRLAAAAAVTNANVQSYNTNRHSSGGGYSSPSRGGNAGSSSKYTVQASLYGRPPNVATEAYGFSAGPQQAYQNSPAHGGRSHAAGAYGSVLSAAPMTYTGPLPFNSNSSVSMPPHDPPRHYPSSVPRSSAASMADNSASAAAAAAAAAAQMAVLQAFYNQLAIAQAGMMPPPLNAGGGGGGGPLLPHPAQMHMGASAASYSSSTWTAPSEGGQLTIAVRADRSRPFVNHNSYSRGGGDSTPTSSSHSIMTGSGPITTTRSDTASSYFGR